MAIADDIYSEPNSIDAIVRGGFKKPASIPSIDYQQGMLPTADAAYSNSISPARVSEQPLTPFQKGASSIGAGLKAGEAGNGQPTYDMTDAAVKVGESTVAGAIGGAAVGGPWGAVAGGAAAALESSVNAWLSLRASKRQRAQMAAIKKEAQERQAKEDAMSAEQKAYERSRDSKAGAADVYFKTIGQLERLAANDAALKDMFIKRGY